MIVPVELSVKVTVSGLSPMVGLPTKLADGTNAPEPSNALVWLPPLLVKTTTLLELTALVGLKLTTRLVEPKPGSVKGVPEMMMKGPPSTAATPLVTGAPPRFVTTKLACALDPT